MALRDMEHDRSRLEEGEISFLVGRNLPKRMQRAMRGFLHLTERNEANVVRLAHFFERPANAHIERQSPAAIGRAFKSGDGGGHWNAPGSSAVRKTETWLIEISPLIFVAPAFDCSTRGRSMDPRSDICGHCTA